MLVIKKTVSFIEQLHEQKYPVHLFKTYVQNDLSQLVNLDVNLTNDSSYKGFIFK